MNARKVAAVGARRIERRRAEQAATRERLAARLAENDRLRTDLAEARILLARYLQRAEYLGHGCTLADDINGGGCRAFLARTKDGV